MLSLSLASLNYKNPNMKKLLKISVLLIFFVLPFFLLAQNTADEMGGVYPLEFNDANHPCITPEQYKIIEKQCLDNIKLLGLENVSHKGPLTTSFIWPVRTANGLEDCSYYFIGNYLDQDTTSPGIRDWNCGTVTYDGHQGTDICTYPYPFYKMDNDQVEVIAAAPGTIINKVDGNFDRNCAMGNLTANYIVIQHADGSCAMYWHIKKNSLTSKTLGQAVIAGEYLGVVGSSGSSTGPHLHFEVLSGITINTLNDAYSGTCNTLNANSWWAVQKPYTEPAIIQVSVHPVLADFGTCPATEIPNEDSCFGAGDTVKLYTFFRNETSGLVSNMRIINPNGTTFTSWTHNSNVSHLSSYWISTKVLPIVEGTYTFEATYNGIICSKNFKIDCNATEIEETSNISKFNIFPNPCKDFIQINNITENQKDVKVIVKDILGNIVISDNYNPTNGSIKLNLQTLPVGLYFIELNNGNALFNLRFVKN